MITKRSTKLKHQACGIEKILIVNWYFSHKQAGNGLGYSAKLSCTASGNLSPQASLRKWKWQNVMWIWPMSCKQTQKKQRFYPSTPSSPLKKGQFVDFKTPAIIFSYMTSSNIYFCILNMFGLIIILLWVPAKSEGCELFFYCICFKSSELRIKREFKKFLVSSLNIAKLCLKKQQRLGQTASKVHKAHFSFVNKLS